MTGTCLVTALPGQPNFALNDGTVSPPNAFSVVVLHKKKTSYNTIYRVASASEVYLTLFENMMIS